MSPQSTRPQASINAAEGRRRFPPRQAGRWAAGPGALVAVLLALGVGAAVGYWYAARTADRSPAKTAAAPAAPSASKARRILYYRSPMNPSATSPVPTKDSMGMDYVPVYADEAQAAVPGTVRIDPVIVQDIGVRTATVVRRTISRRVRAVGRVTYDEDLLTRLHPKVKGWVQRTYVDRTGQKVAKGAVLLSIYSPQLVTSEQEYLLALRNRRGLEKSPFPDIRRGARELMRTARERLALLDMPAAQIRQLERTGRVLRDVQIRSPFSGYVMRVGARDGQYVTPGTELYAIADLHKVWVYAYIYEYEIPWVRKGDEADLHLAALPGKTFRGRITYVYPALDMKTRTLRVRFEFDNPNLELKPMMFANVSIHAAPRRNVVVVPSQAVIRTGTRNVAFVVRSPGKFEPRDVRLGVTSEGLTQILSGLRPGERVVTSAEFLIDSESNLREAAAKMLEPAKPAGAGSATAKEPAPAGTGVKSGAKREAGHD